ncbi:MAG: hypothetical protein J7K40_05520 [candidate division Zixibacteria bacterium]|nr:hypothetical protein [candidate division Zixibacteria bacterium]
MNAPVFYQSSHIRQAFAVDFFSDKNTPLTPPPAAGDFKNKYPQAKAFYPKSPAAAGNF